MELRGLSELSPHLRRITLGGDELADFAVESPAASVRLLLPRSGETGLTIPTWNGNEFLHDDGERPTIRTYTPRRFNADALELDLDVVLHDGGAVPAWLANAEPGDPVAVSGPGRGYDIDTAVRRFVLAGDESAIPAISQLLEHLPIAAEVVVIIEVGQPDARHDLPPHPNAGTDWLDLPPDGAPGSALVASVEGLVIAPDTRIWAAGEAASMQRIRRHLFERLGLPRKQAVVRGYWKVGRGGDLED